jgi:hypothetical protein
MGSSTNTSKDPQDNTKSARSTTLISYTAYTPSKAGGSIQFDRIRRCVQLAVKHSIEGKCSRRVQPCSPRYLHHMERIISVVIIYFVSMYFNYVLLVYKNYML